MIIESLDITGKFTYLWLKDIKGVNLSVHCAGCLRGDYVKDISPKIESIQNLELPFDMYYFCGVAYPRNWDNNFHLAFKKKEGSIIEIEEKGIKILIRDAARIDIKPINFKTNTSDKKYIEAYNTCRNWQFANMYKEGLV